MQAGSWLLSSRPVYPFASPQPAKGAFDNPALRLDGKAWLFGVRLGNPQPKSERFLQVGFLQVDREGFMTNQRVTVVR